MDSYVVLARKYRSKQFADIVGQLPIVRTLVNAIRLNRTHHAYVFSGSRGIGKTSIARIFAKTLRCQNVKTEGEFLTSCDNCSDCHDITAGTSMDVLEIDGASNNGVDSIREIRETVRFMPTTGTKKIYIIDEVHMLSTAAFNALLKTLEEPPEHVIFIFATTESHKIPETILGRCQRFDFQRMTISQIVTRLKEVLALEKLPYEDPALLAIARAAEGSMRDSLSILDQVISFSGLNVTLKAVRDSIGMIGQEMVTELVESIFARDAKKALLIAEQAFDQGVNLRELLSSVLETVHSLLLIRVGVEPKTTMTADEIKVLKEFSEVRSIEETEVLFQMFHHALDWVVNSPQPKLLLDTLLIKAALADVLVRVGGDGETVEVPARAPAAAASSGVAVKAAVVSEALPVVAATVAVAPTTPVAPVKIETVAASAPASWEEFVSAAFDKTPIVAMILEKALIGVLPTKESPILKVAFKLSDKPSAERLALKSNKDFLAAFLKERFGFAAGIDISAEAEGGESMAEREERLRKEKKDARIKAVESNPIIQEAKSLFGVELSSLEVDE